MSDLDFEHDPLTEREKRFIRVMLADQRLIQNIYINLGKKTIPIWHDLQDQIRALTAGDQIAISEVQKERPGEW